MKLTKYLLLFLLAFALQAQGSIDVHLAPYAATGGGMVDDTAAIQKALTAASGTAATVLIPPGTYLINPTAANGRGLVITGAMTLAMAPGAVLKALPSAAKSYVILAVVGASNVTITGGILEGERSAHVGTTGEWGHGLSILNSKGVTVVGTTARQCWGDGFYTAGSSTVALCGVTADHNRRQGLSITSVDGMVVDHSTFKNTAGTLPEDGIDVEPNVGETSKNVRITGCTVTGNAGFGIEAGVPLSYAGKAWIQGLQVDSNTVTGNGLNTLSTSPRAGIEVSNTAGHSFTGNTTSGNVGCGFLFRFQANDNTVTSNVVSSNGGDGVQQYLCTGNVINGNIITGNGAHGIYSPNSTGTTTPNTLSGNKL